MEFLKSCDQIPNIRRITFEFLTFGKFGPPYKTPFVAVLNTGIISKAQGSAYIEQGQTKAICAVYGPREIPRKSDFSMKGILNCFFERTPFARKKRRAPGPQGQDGEEDEVSKNLSEALEATVCMVCFLE